MDHRIHHLDDINADIYLTKEEHNMFAHDDESTISEQYLRGYQNAIDDVQRKLKLISRDLVINKGRPNQNQPSTSKQNQEKEKEKETKKDTTVHKNYENKEHNSKENKKPLPIDLEKPISSFSLQDEFSKIKISIPFNELLRNNEYMDKITKFVRNQGDDHPDI